MDHGSRFPLALAYRPWAIDKPRLLSMLEEAQMRAGSLARMDHPAIAAAVLAAASAPLGQMIGAVAVIPVYGCITQKSDFYSWYFGGTSVERLTASFRQYLHDQAVSAIVLDVSSGGGEVYGVPEFAEEIFAARAIKKTIAVCNPFMASAAYWIGSACEEVYQIPSGESGGCGVYACHEDISKMLDAMGVTITFIQYGEHKTEGNPYEPLDASTIAELQSSVDYYGRMFDAAVAKHRNVSMADVKERFGQGRVLRAPDAKKAGMIDKIATFDEVLAKLAPKRSRGLAASIADNLGAMRANLAEHARAIAAIDPIGEPEGTLAETASDSVEPDEDGKCPDGYEKRDDGLCHLAPAADNKAAAAAAQQLQADQDAVNITLALTE